MLKTLKPLKTGLFLAGLLAGLSAVGASQDGRDAASYVKVAPALTRDTLAPGATGEITFTFTPKKGFHVNAVPPMAVAFDTLAPVVAGGKIDIPADTATGYLKSSLPVRQAFTLSSSVKRAGVELRGVLTYYYCSDAEGWCRKENMPFSLPLTVK